MSKLVMIRIKILLFHVLALVFIEIELSAEMGNIADCNIVHTSIIHDFGSLPYY